MPSACQKPRPVHPANPPRPSRTARPKGQGQGQPDIRQTREYKLAARRWTSTIVALPIVLYTSYILYERVYGDQKRKRPSVQQQQQQQDQSPSTS